MSDPHEAEGPPTPEASSVPDSGPLPAEGAGAAELAGRGRLLLWGLLVLIAAASVPLHVGDPTPDVSWLISMCERIFAGQVAYVDIMETTPPVPALLYMPAVLAGQALGMSTERALVPYVYLSVLGVLGLVSWILREDTPAQARFGRVFLFAAAVGLFLAPSDAFAQREYFAALTGLPIVAVFVRHAQTGAWPPALPRALAAVLAGLTIAIKPPLFALPGGVLFCYYLWRTRSLRFAYSSGLILGGVVGVALTLASLAAFPDYLGPIWDVMRDVYVPAKESLWSAFKTREGVAVLGALGAAFLLGRQSEDSLPGLWLTVWTGAGFFLAYVAQGKFFAYHAYPAVLLGSLALALASAERVASADSPARRRLLGSLLLLVWIGFSATTFVAFRDGRPVMKDLSWAAELEAPTVLAVSPDISTGFPLSRRFGGVWVNRIHSQWVSRYVRFLLEKEPDLSPERRELLASYRRADLLWVLETIEREAPELILLDRTPANAWLLPALEELRPGFLDGYEVLAEEGRIRVLRRRSK